MMTNHREKIYSRSSGETIREGERFCRNLLAQSSGSIVSLEGDLGTGKTTFVQGIFRALAVRRRATSPTFIIMRKITLPGSMRFRNVYHIDAYRIQDPREIESLGISDILTDPSSLVLVEWPERMGRVLPQKRIRVRFAHGDTEHERVISISYPT